VSEAGKLALGLGRPPRMLPDSTPRVLGCARCGRWICGRLVRGCTIAHNVAMAMAVVAVLHFVLAVREPTVMLTR
jgi:hypothetical protein